MTRAPSPHLPLVFNPRLQRLTVPVKPWFRWSVSKAALVCVLVLVAVGCWRIEQ